MPIGTSQQNAIDKHSGTTTLTKLTSDASLPAWRPWLMRVPFFFTGVLFSFTAWGTLIEHWGTFEPNEGVAFAFWGALSLIALLGLRFPVRMLPILLLQFLYKLIWIAAVGYPLMVQGELGEVGMDLFKANVAGVMIDGVAIPWLYTIRVYIINAFRSG